MEEQVRLWFSVSEVQKKRERTGGWRAGFGPQALRVVLLNSNGSLQLPAEIQGLADLSSVIFY